MSETTGQKHTNYPYKRYLENKSRVTLNGKRYRLGNPNHPYHQIYTKKGMDGAFEAMGLTPIEGIKTTIHTIFSELKEGEVYIMHCASFPGWIKVGMAVNSLDRIKQFQTGSPYRDYRLIKTYKVENRREAEAAAHKELSCKGIGRRGEWFYMSHAVATSKLDKIFPEAHQFELF
tara:strand:+ start:3089 stop:3613 length:525 start_codon:yes stop_codon:yes gene_type:complete